ncbi:unnamed protein product [Auanema sp. JU1783]|nr:unnamed protein product [Auanema sp. JU1783]
MDTSTTSANTTKAGRGRKRAQPSTEPTTAKRAPRTTTARVHLSYNDFVLKTHGKRILSCGEGDQLGHPGRTTSKKPRKVDIVEDENLEVVQAVAGGVHSVFLTSDGVVYSCGINEKGTVPGVGVEPEGSTDEYKKIEFPESFQALGKIVMLACGASFTAALTAKGSVFAWGNLRDANGKLDVHDQLTQMQKAPIVLLKHTKEIEIVKIAAGENHLVMLSQDLKVYTFGDGSMGQLGRSIRTDRIRSQYMAAKDAHSLHVPSFMGGKKFVKAKNIFADGYWTAILSVENDLYVCGLNNYGQLGIPIEEEKAESEEDNQKEDNRELRVFHPTLSKAFSGHNWTNIQGVQHIIARDENGEMYGIGKNTDNALGLGTWKGNDDQENWRYDTLQKIDVDGNTVSGISAKLGCSVCWTSAGDAYSWGCDTSGQLGLGIKEDEDDKVVEKPQKITSAHLNDYKIISVSIADNHSIFLAEPSADEE